MTEMADRSYKTAANYEVWLIHEPKEPLPYQVFCLNPEREWHWDLRFANLEEAEKEFNRWKD